MHVFKYTLLKDARAMILTTGTNLSLSSSAAVERFPLVVSNAAESFDLGWTGTAATAHKSLKLSLSADVIMALHAAVGRVDPL